MAQQHACGNSVCAVGEGLLQIIARPQDPDVPNVTFEYKNPIIQNGGEQLRMILAIQSVAKRLDKYVIVAFQLQVVILRCVKQIHFCLRHSLYRNSQLTGVLFLATRLSLLFQIQDSYAY